MVEEPVGEVTVDEPTYDEPADQYDEEYSEEPIEAYVEEPVYEQPVEQAVDDPRFEESEEVYVEEQPQEEAYGELAQEPFEEPVTAFSEPANEDVAQQPAEEYYEEPAQQRYEEPVQDLYSGQGWGDDLTEDEAACFEDQHQEYQEEVQPEPEDILPAHPEPTPSYSEPVQDLSPPPTPPLEQPQLEAEVREDESETIIVGYSEEEVLSPMAQEIHQALDEALNEETSYPERTEEPYPVEDQYSPPMTPADNRYGHDEFPPSSNDHLKSPAVASNWGRQSQLLSPRPLTPPLEDHDLDYPLSPQAGWDANQHRPVTPPNEPQDHQLLSPLTFQQSPLVDQYHEEQYNSATEVYEDNNSHDNDGYWAGHNAMSSPTLSEPHLAQQESLEDKGPYPAFSPRPPNTPPQQNTHGFVGPSTDTERNRSIEADTNTYSSEPDSFMNDRRSSEPEFEIMNAGTRSIDTYDAPEDSPLPHEMQSQSPQPAFEEYPTQQTSVSPVKVQSVEYQIPHDQASIQEYLQEEPAGPYEDYAYVQPEQIPEEEYEEQRAEYQEYAPQQAEAVQQERIAEQQQYQPPPPPPQSRPLSLFPKQTQSANPALRSNNEGAYQSNEPMQMNTISEDSDEGTATSNVSKPSSGKAGTQKYQWLLPLMATATLGFGMEALEEQFHASSNKSSGWTFKSWFRIGKRKQNAVVGPMSGSSTSTVGQTDQPSQPSQQSPQVQFTDNSTARGLNVMQNSSPQTRNMSPQASNEWRNHDEADLEEPKPRKKGIFAWFGRRNKNAVNDVEAPSPVPQESYEMRDPNQTRTTESSQQSNSFGNMTTVESNTLNQGQAQSSQSPQMVAYQQPPVQGDVDQAPKKPGFWARLFSKRTKPQNAATLANSPGAGPDGSPDINGQKPEKKKGFWARLFSRSNKKKSRPTDDIELGNINAQDDQIARVGRVKSGSPQLIQGPNRRTSAVGAIVGPSGRQQQPQQWQQTIPEDTTAEDNVAEFNEPPNPKTKKRGIFARSMGRRSGHSKNKNKNKGKGKAVDENNNGEWEDVEEQTHETATLPPARPKLARVKKYGAVVSNSEGLAQQHVTAPKQKERGKIRTGAAAANPGNWFWMDVYWK
ncbi:hypothetical protein B0T21DRAFT_375168 [Apiosordaria backusii]|uniref:Uncharacterized protein n=1 Tax=Apiosordaria backusii TaxID=314023 RepID=A0AA40AIU9_9PEZI|nr:hypothetical protein B0T21DRAFT_375168 [Apiosordaria backusii]